MATVMAYELLTFELFVGTQKFEPQVCSNLRSPVPGLYSDAGLVFAISTTFSQSVEQLENQYVGHFCSG